MIDIVWVAITYSLISQMIMVSFFFFMGMIKVSVTIVDSLLELQIIAWA